MTKAFDIALAAVARIGKPEVVKTTPAKADAQVRKSTAK